MKKLIILLVLVITVIAANAQTSVLSTGSGTICDHPTSYTLTNTTNSWFLIKGYSDWITSYDYQVHLDSLTGDHTYVAVSFYGRKFSTDGWTQIGSTVNWKGTTSGHDTTITLSTTSGARWREYKASFTGTGTGTTNISLQKFKLWYQ